MKAPTATLMGAQLDWAVAECVFQWRVAEGEHVKEWVLADHRKGGTEPYSTDWLRAGEIIERECIELRNWGMDGWNAKATNYTFLNTPREKPEFAEAYGPTPMIAAMRCYVASTLGEEVELPEELG